MDGIRQMSSFSQARRLTVGDTLMGKIQTNWLPEKKKNEGLLPFV
jgi:hypothetical protein